MQQSRLTASKNSLFCYYRNSGNLRQKLRCMRLKQIPVKGKSGLKKIHNQSVNWSPLARPAGDTGEKLSGDTVKQQLLLYHSSPQSLTCHGPHTAILSDQALLFLRNNRFLSPTSLTDCRLYSSCQSFLGTPHKVFSNPAWAGAPLSYPHGEYPRVVHTWSLLLYTSIPQLRR